MYREDFQFYFDEARGDLESYLRPCINQIHEPAVELGLEFDGYYKTNKEKANSFLCKLPDDYFVNDDRRTLYVLSAALCNKEIMEMLDEALKRTPYYPIRYEDICVRINEMGRSGISFLPEDL